MQKSHMFSVKIVLIILKEINFHSSNNEMLESTMVWGDKEGIQKPWGQHPIGGMKSPIYLMCG